MSLCLSQVVGRLHRLGEVVVRCVSRLVRKCQEGRTLLLIPL